MVVWLIVYVFKGVLIGINKYVLFNYFLFRVEKIYNGDFIGCLILRYVVLICCVGN